MDYIATEKAPKAIGPYSQAVRAGNVLYTSGQVPLDPATGRLVEGEFDAMVRQVFRNLEAVLAEGGMGFGQVVKATVFLRSMSDFAVLNGIYAEIFGDHKPARSTVAVAELPLDARVEVELIAVAD